MALLKALLNPLLKPFLFHLANEKKGDSPMSRFAGSSLFEPRLLNLINESLGSIPKTLPIRGRKVCSENKKIYIYEKNSIVTFDLNGRKIAEIPFETRIFDIKDDFVYYPDSNKDEYPVIIKMDFTSFKKEKILVLGDVEVESIGIHPIDESIFIFDGVAEEVIRYSSTGEHLYTFKYDMLSVCNFAFNTDDKETYVISDKIDVFDETGTLLRSFGDFYSPRGIFDSNQVIIADYGKNYLEIFDREGTPIRTVPIPSDESLSIAAISKSYCVVLDCMDQAVIIKIS